MDARELLKLLEEVKAAKLSPEQALRACETFAV